MRAAKVRAQNIIVDPETSYQQRMTTHADKLKEERWSP